MRGTDAGIVLGLHGSRHERELLRDALDLGVTQLDTAFNYYGFASHRTLAKALGCALESFRISTKVGYFRANGGAEHSLAPERLMAAIEQSVSDLTVVPSVLLLHNPEAALNGLPENVARAHLEEAFITLNQARRAGLCEAWGFSSWDPGLIVAALRSADSPLATLPDVVLCRSGLLVPNSVLIAIEELWSILGVAEDARWGMSPFRGEQPEVLFSDLNCRRFIVDGERCSNVQAAFRAAYALPYVSRVVVGTNRRKHLEKLVAAMSLHVDDEVIRRYRGMLRKFALSAVEND